MVQFSIETPVGELWVTCVDAQVVSVDFAKVDGVPVSPVTQRESGIIAELMFYFQNAQHQPELPVSPAGTEFQQRVWRALSRIPAGSVETYGSLAQKLKTSARAVGNACRANPIPVLIPCHRVVSAHGLGGYMGQTEGKEMQIKQWLLRHEGVLQ